MRGRGGPFFISGAIGIGEARCSEIALIPQCANRHHFDPVFPGIGHVTAADDGYLSDPNICFKLTDNIDLKNQEWTPIGDAEHAFQGTFDGGNYTVSGLSGSSVGLFGTIGESGTVKNLGVSGAVAGQSPVGGIAGTNQGTIENCCNAATVTGASAAGGIVGTNSGTVKNCYNTGTVTGAQGNTGGIAGTNSGTVTNSYFLTDTATSGIGSGVGEATEKTAGQFASGEVAWLLQKGQETQTWGQTVGTVYPELTDDTEKKVSKVTFMVADAEYDVEYANPTGLTELPAAPEIAGYIFEGWSTTQSGSPDFVKGSRVSKDMTVYAVGRKTFGGETDAISLTTTYGSGLTENLSEHVHYETAPESPATDKFTYSITGGNETLGAEIAGDELKIPETANAGEYSLNIEATEKKPQYSLMRVDYGIDLVTLTVKVSIARADPKVTAPTVNNLTYTGAEQELVTAGSATGGTMQYSLDGESYSTDIPKGTEAKEYTVWYKVVGDANHNDNEPQMLTVSIGKAEPTVTKAPTPNNRTYDGAEHPLVEGGIAEGGTMQYSLDGESYSTDIPKGTEAKEYTVWYMVAGDANHNDTTPQAITVSIGKAESTVTKAPTPNNRTYDGAEHPLAEGGIAEGGTMQYSLDGESYSTDIPKGTEAKEYTVWYKVVGDANHNDTAPQTITVSIGKAESTVTKAPTPNNMTYTGAEQELVTAGSATGGMMQYSLDGESYSTDIPKGTEAKEYTVWYKVVGDANHNDTAPQTLTVSIGKAESTVTKAPTPNNRTYTGAEQELVTAGSATGGTMQYSLDGESYSNDIPKGTEAKEYTVWYKVVGDANHNDTESQMLTVSIGKAESTVMKAPTPILNVENICMV